MFYDIELSNLEEKEEHLKALKEAREILDSSFDEIKEQFRVLEDYDLKEENIEYVLEKYSESCLDKIDDKISWIEDLIEEEDNF